MKHVLRLSIVATACLLVQQARVAAYAQGSGPEGARGGASPSWTGRTSPAPEPREEATTPPDKADGTVSTALTGERHPLYRLTRSDVIEVSFSFSPEFNQTVAIQPDGFLALRAVGSVYAEGRTAPELARDIQQAYAGMLHEPEVTVALKEFERPYFIAAGEVARPGKYELRSDTTVSEALAMAGGFTKQARHSQVLLFRRVSADLREAQVLNVKKMLRERNLQEDVHVCPGDFLFVPQSTVSQIKRYVPVPNLGMYLNPSQF